MFIHAKSRSACTAVVENQTQMNEVTEYPIIQRDCERQLSPLVETIPAPIPTALVNLSYPNLSVARGQGPVGSSSEGRCDICLNISVRIMGYGGGYVNIGECLLNTSVAEVLLRVRKAVVDGNVQGKARLVCAGRVLRCSETLADTRVFEGGGILELSQSVDGGMEDLSPSGQATKEPDGHVEYWPSEELVDMTGSIQRFFVPAEVQKYLRPPLPREALKYEQALNKPVGPEVVESTLSRGFRDGLWVAESIFRAANMAAMDTLGVMPPCSPYASLLALKLYLRCAFRSLQRDFNC